jgi:DNA-binding MarR family transcriptional regulator
MTTREFLNAVKSAAISDEMTEKAQAMLAALDKKNEQRKSKPSKVAVANEPLKQAIVDYLTANGAKVSSEIGEALQMTTQKASALCRQLVEDGTLKSEEVKVPKRGKVKAYSVQ